MVLRQGIVDVDMRGLMHDEMRVKPKRGLAHHNTKQDVALIGRGTRVDYDGTGETQGAVLSNTSRGLR